MGEIVIVDTSILLNVLNVPGRNEQREAVLTELKQCIDDGATLLLPLGAVLETGNHIARLANGNQRRTGAKVFQDRITEALAGEAPWDLVPLPDRNQLRNWLNEFPDFAAREVGLVDLSIIKAWDAARERHPSSRVRIWSLDKHLQGYDHKPG